MSGWTAILARQPGLSELFGTARHSFSGLLDACPEIRHVLHGDLLNRNVLVAPDASRLTAVFDWACLAYGDFLYEAAWFTFWAPWHAGLAALDFRSVIRAHYDATGVGVPRFAERLRCYELHIGLTHLAYCAFAGRDADLLAVARRTRELLGQAWAEPPGCAWRRTGGILGLPFRRGGWQPPYLPTTAMHGCPAAGSPRHAEVVGDGLVDLVGVPVPGSDELAAQGAAPRPPENPGQVRLSVANVVLALACGHATERKAMPSSTFRYTAGDGQQITAYRWDPPGTPRAAVQVTHGMGEHALRYEDFAQALNGHGLIVYAQDHRGHGATAGDGVLGDLGEGGWPGLVDDIGLLTAEIRAQHPSLRVILLGHSMGSFAVQQYLLDHSADVDGVILTGTAVIDLLEPALDLDQPLPRCQCALPAR